MSYNEGQERMDGGSKNLMRVTPTETEIAHLENQVCSNSECIIDDQLLKQKPRSPTLMFPARNGVVYSLPVLSVSLDTTFYISVSHTKLRIVFKNTTKNPITGSFVLPTEGTVTSISARIGDGRFVESSYISTKDASSQGFIQNGAPADDPTQSYMPGCFRLQLPEIPKNITVAISVQILEDLDYYEGQFHFNFPLCFMEGATPPNITPRNWLRIDVKINCALQNVRVYSESHKVDVINQNDNITKISAVIEEVKDFHLSYSTPSSDISAATLYSHPEGTEKGCFFTIVSPPSSVLNNTPRDIIFLFDRSGSMGGKPWENGARALDTALTNMRAGDRFGIVCFDHEMKYFSIDKGTKVDIGMLDGLFHINEENVFQAKQWIKQNPARGLTDIKTPLEWAYALLQSCMEGNRMQFVVLITDGAVNNEREIVQATAELAKEIRVLTFGIGRYCNWYFLKMLALKTRGWNSGAVMVDDIDKRMERLLNRASVPIFRDVQISGIEKVKLFPLRIPDLFAGKPIILAGEISHGRFPSSVVLKGILSNGQKHSFRVMTEQVSQDVPIKRIFIKRQIDQLVAEHWLTQDSEIEEQLVQLSLKENMPTPYSQMVAFEVTPEQKKEFDNDIKKGHKGWSGTKIAAAGACVMVVGTGVFLLGNVAATAAGASPLIDGFAEGLLGGLAGGGDLGCCEICGGCADLGEVCGGCPELGELGDALGDCCNGVGEGCSNLVDGIPGACGEIASCCEGVGSLCQGMGESCEGITTVCAGCGGVLAAIYEGCSILLDECPAS